MVGLGGHDGCGNRLRLAHEHLALLRGSKSHGEAAAVRSQHLFVVLDLVLVVVKCTFVSPSSEWLSLRNFPLRRIFPLVRKTARGAI